MAAENLCFGLWQMKLLFTGIDPHVERTEVDVWITGESKPGYVKQCGDALIRYGEIDVLEQLYVAHILAASVVFAHHSSPVTSSVGPL